MNEYEAKKRKGKEKSKKQDIFIQLNNFLHKLQQRQIQ